MKSERAMQYVWKHRLYTEAGLVTTDGLPVCVIDPGISNTDAGPDFFNAKIRIGNTVWAGNVEIHCRASDWSAHNHDKDKAYDSVILHVVACDDATVTRRDNKALIPQMILPVPQKIEDNIEWLLSRDAPVSCVERIGNILPLYLSDWMTALQTERLERKTNDINIRLTQCAKDWNEVFYQTLMRSFGFGTNSDAFELLAKSLPYKYILKHRNNRLQVEALLLGQAELLQREADVAVDSYLASLRYEYDFLSKKYDLHPVNGYLFKSLRVRPVNFPHVRLAQIAAVLCHEDILFSKIVETTGNVDALKTFFDVVPSDYWRSHYHFHAVSPTNRKSLGKNAANNILINTVVPILFAYGKYKRMPEYGERALQLLEKLPPENNHITTIFKSAGIIVQNAGDTQALLQLKREYCDRKKCLYCRIGFRIIGQTSAFR